MDTHQAVDAAYHQHYGRLVAFLAARFRDVAAVEDALADAFEAALTTWPKQGVPAQPAAWLSTVACRRLLNRRRHERVADEAADELTARGEARAELADGAPAPDVEIPDKRLELLFVCAHPAIDPGVQTPLMMQVVLGLDAARIASAFLVAPATLGQRLVRAKAKIRDARIPFSVPGREHFAERLRAVMDAIYAAYGTGWEDVDGVDARRRGLASEAIWLARVLVQLLPDEAEPTGLLALMLYCEARKAARRADDGSYVPLTEQDVTRWDAQMLNEAEASLRTAAAAGDAPGRYQLEAVIQSIHCDGRRRGTTRWDLIAAVYDRLLTLSPTSGVAVGRAAAILHARGAPQALAALDAIDTSRRAVADYQPYWAVRASVLAAADRIEEARQAYRRAVGLSEDPEVRAFLARQESALEG